MKLEISRLYISRKRGKGMTLRYRISALLPLLVLFSVTAALSFAITFIYSVSERIDRMIDQVGATQAHGNILY